MTPLVVRWSMLAAWLSSLKQLDDRGLLMASVAIDAERQRRSESPAPADTWDPWAVAVRALDVRFEWRRLPDGMGGLTERHASTGRYRVILDPRLTIAEAAETLTHELTHVERGVEHWSDDERAEEEAEVRRITAERMTRYQRRPFVIPAPLELAR